MDVQRNSYIMKEGWSPDVPTSLGGTTATSGNWRKGATTGAYCRYYYRFKTATVSQFEPPQTPRRNNYIKMAFTSGRSRRPRFLLDRVNFHEIKQRNSEVVHLHLSHADKRMTRSLWQLQMICWKYNGQDAPTNYSLFYKCLNTLCPILPQFYTNSVRICAKWLRHCDRTNELRSKHSVWMAFLFGSFPMTPMDKSS